MTPFKIDTGAEVTAVSKETWHMLGKPALQPANKHLFGPAQQPLAVLDQFSCHLSHKRREVQRQGFVVDDLKMNLLVLPAITILHLAVRADNVQATVTAENIRKKFPKVFQALGTLTGEYNIQLRPDAKLHALFTP